MTTKTTNVRTAKRPVSDKAPIYEALHLLGQAEAQARRVRVITTTLEKRIQTAKKNVKDRDIRGYTFHSSKKLKKAA